MLVNIIYGFLPGNIQKIVWVRIAAVVSALLIFVYTSVDFIEEYQNRIFATVSNDGSIVDSNNFPWKVLKSKNENEIIYLVEKLHVDPSQVSIKTESENIKPSLRLAFDGLAIIFNLPEEKVPGFEVRFKN